LGNFYYSAVIGVLLLFPWSLVGLMIMGALWERARVRARIRVRA
jgi:hypothetical protein